MANFCLSCVPMIMMPMILGSAAALTAQQSPAQERTDAPLPITTPPITPPAVAPNVPQSSDAVRGRLRGLAKVYLSTLEVMHHRYFHGQRAMVPARAMEDVFADVERELDIHAHWIAVNTKAMSLNHEPKTEFDKQAAAAIAEGKPEWAATIDGTFHLAVPVPLTSSCINCHAGMFREPPNKKSFAGLILRMPLDEKAVDK